MSVQADGSSSKGFTNFVDGGNPVAPVGVLGKTVPDVVESINAEGFVGGHNIVLSSVEVVVEDVATTIIFRSIPGVSIGVRAQGLTIQVLGSRWDSRSGGDLGSTVNTSKAFTSVVVVRGIVVEISPEGVTNFVSGTSPDEVVGGAGETGGISSESGVGNSDRDGISSGSDVFGKDKQVVLDEFRNTTKVKRFFVN